MTATEVEELRTAAAKISHLIGDAQLNALWYRAGELPDGDVRNAKIIQAHSEALAELTRIRLLLGWAPESHEFEAQTRYSTVA